MFSLAVLVRGGRRWWGGGEVSWAVRPQQQAGQPWLPLRLAALIWLACAGGKWAASPVHIPSQWGGSSLWFGCYRHPTNDNTNVPFAFFDHLTWLSHAQGKLIKSVRADLIPQEISHYKTGDVCIPVQAVASFTTRLWACFWYGKRYWASLSDLHNYIDLWCLWHVRLYEMISNINSIYHHNAARQVQLRMTRVRPAPQSCIMPHTCYTLTTLSCLKEIIWTTSGWGKGHNEGLDDKRKSTSRKSLSVLKSSFVSWAYVMWHHNLGFPS